MTRIFIVCYIGTGNSIVRAAQFDTEAEAVSYIMDGDHSHMPSDLFILFGVK